MFFVYLFNDSSKYTIHSGNSTEENQVRLAESSLPHEALEGPLQVAERKIVTTVLFSYEPYVQHYRQTRQDVHTGTTACNTGKSTTFLMELRPLPWEGIHYGSVNSVNSRWLGRSN